MNPSPIDTSAAARSLQVFGLYLCGAGALLLTAPGLLLAVLGLPVPADTWMRLAGLLALALGVTDLTAAREGSVALLRLSVGRRAVAGGVMVALVLLGTWPLPLLLLAGVDLAAAAWTAAALRQTTAVRHQAA